MTKIKKKIEVFFTFLKVGPKTSIKVSNFAQYSFFDIFHAYP